MAINIHHTYTANVEITFYSNDVDLHCTACGNMDDIAECVCDTLVVHNFTSADVCSRETGEVLMTIERT